MIVYLIRHGRPEYPKDRLGSLLVYGPEADLSCEGSARVIQIAHAIQQREGRPFDTLVTSPYRRAKETAEILAAVLQMDPGSITEEYRLRDTDSTWPGKPLELFLQAWNERRIFNDPHTLETLDDIRARMTSALMDHTVSFHGQMMGFIGHGDPFRAWLYPHDKPFPSYDMLVKSTFESAEGIRVVIHKDGQMEPEIIHDFERT